MSVCLKWHSMAISKLYLRRCASLMLAPLELPSPKTANLEQRFNSDMFSTWAYHLCRSRIIRGTSS